MPHGIVPPVPYARAATGIELLDETVGGGFPLHRAVVVCGGSGTGKTTLGLQFLLAGCEYGEPGAFLTVDQKPQHLRADALAMGWNLDELTRTHQLTLLDASPFFTATRQRGRQGAAADARQLAADLTREIRSAGTQRLAIDSVTSLIPPDFNAAQVDDYVRALVQSLEDNLGCTVLLTCRASATDSRQCCQATRYLSSGVIELRRTRRNGMPGRGLRVVKMRGGSGGETVEWPMRLVPSRGIVLTRTGVEYGPRPLQTLATG